MSATVGFELIDTFLFFYFSVLFLTVLLHTFF